MGRSIRWRLQLWYALVLLAVVSGFAGLLYYRVRAAQLHEVDAALEAAAVHLDRTLGGFPPHELGGKFPKKPRPPRPSEWDGDGPPDRKGPPRWQGKGPPDWDEEGPHGRPPRPERKRGLADLELPGGSISPGEDGPDAAAYFAVWRADGTILKARNLPEGVAPPDLHGPPAQRALLVRRGDYREAQLRGPEGTCILVGRSVRPEQAALRAFAWQLAGAGAVVLAVGLAGGWVVSARILRPVAAISATASSISATNLSQRIDPDKVDRELTDMARVLNAMFDRLEAAFERQARFTGDASHELRTPLAIIRTHAELALARPRSAEEYRETVATCLRAANRMTALVEGLLTLARADGGRLELRREAVDLGFVVEESIDLFRPLAEGKGVSLAASLAPAEVTGDGVRLTQVITNLLSNAVQYNRPGGAVRVELGIAAGEAVLAVTDTGCGIPAEDRPHIFERFYRVDKARARASGGHGLGLAICRSIVEAHGGTIGFETTVERGSTFWVRLPCAARGGG